MSELARSKPAAPDPSARVPTVAWVSLGALTAINLLNYLDRYVVAGMMPELQRVFAIPDQQAGYLQSAFLVTYILCSPVAGYLGDRIPRKYLIASGVGVWSLATIASGLSGTFQHLMLARTVIGVGEAGYATVAPSLISDLFGRDRRGKMLSVFYAAIPVGSALGFMVGGVMAAHFGWRSAFFVAGAPGLAVALFSLLLPEPQRGAHDDDEGDSSPLPFFPSVRALFTNPIYLLDNAGYTLLTFSIGGLAFWMPSFFHRVHEVSMERASVVFGAITVVSGFLGTAVGGWAGDRAILRHAGGYLWISGLGLLIGAPLVVGVAFMPDLTVAYGLSLVAMFFLFFNTGPVNTELVNCVSSNVRSTAVAFNVACIHLLGDAFSPALIGGISDAWGIRSAVAVNAAPLVLGGLLLLVGARWKGRRAPAEVGHHTEDA